MLDFENELMLESFRDDCLVIYARGLGIERLFFALLKMCSEPTQLVFVLNTTSEDQSHFTELLREEGVRTLPKFIANDIPSSERPKVYLEGGVQFITSRILVMDLLQNRVPTDVVTGIIVYNAHRVIDSFQEAFILRLFRQKNKSAFIKALSDSPTEYALGMCELQRVMKASFIRKLYLRPRFHKAVQRTLETTKPAVQEIIVGMPETVRRMQFALLDIINSCMRDVRTASRLVGVQIELSTEELLGRWFDLSVRTHLDPVWHQLSERTRKLVGEMQILRQLLISLESQDCINFYSYIESIRSNERVFNDNSGWLYSDEAVELFTMAKQRVFGADEDAEHESELKKENFEVPAKWSALEQVLNEIETDTSFERRLVLVVGRNERVCKQLYQFLTEGSKATLYMIYRVCYTDRPSWPSLGVDADSAALFDDVTCLVDQELLDPSQHVLMESLKEKQKADIARKKRKKAAAVEGELSLTQIIEAKGGSQDRSCDANVDEAGCRIIIQPLQDSLSLQRTLARYKPTHVVLYDVDVGFMRSLEIHQAVNPAQQLHVSFIMTQESTEEQRYLTMLKKEVEAFEWLIQEHKNVVIPTEFDLSRAPAPVGPNKEAKEPGEEQADVAKVIVDTREFRSELPSILYKRGVEIEPITLTVGDYLLTPETCVERKSVSDLIGSLNSGRLYDQTQAMTRQYKRSILLIEFDPSKPFNFAVERQSQAVKNNLDLEAKLTLLTLHFPRLRIIWSQSPAMTAEVFEDLKWGRPQPEIPGDASNAVASEDVAEARIHYSSDVLFKLPGVFQAGAKHIVESVKDMSSLCSQTEGSLKELLGSQYGAELYRFFNVEATEADIGKPSSSTNSNVEPRKPRQRGVRRLR